jgi:hypothetical protein
LGLGKSGRGRSLIYRNKVEKEEGGTLLGLGGGRFLRRFLGISEYGDFLAAEFDETGDETTLEGRFACIA